MKQYVGIVLVKRNGSVLAQLRDDKPDIDSPNLWSTVGGLKELEDEDLKKAGKRELLEETDYDCKEKDLRLLVRDSFSKPNGETVERTLFWAWYDGKQEIHTNEGQEIRFLSPNELTTFKNYDINDIELLKKASEKSMYASDPERGS